MNKVVAIIQARLGSERLPNKVLLQIPPESGVSMLEMVIRKALLAKTVDEVVVVTPDKELVKICKMCGVNYFVKSWSERDVLREFYFAAEIFRPDVIVRLTADCPLLRPEEIDRCVNTFKERETIYVDILYNTDESTGQLNGEGSDVEVFWNVSLCLAFQCAEKPEEREHATLWMRNYLRTKFLDSAPLGLKSVNTYQDYLDVCRIISKKQLTIFDNPV